MTEVTQQALRVYAALSQLRQGDGDVLDALVPFFEPILERMNGKFFDSQLFSNAVRHLYGWHFTKDIAEQFIPRFQKRKFLKRAGTIHAATYVVTYENGNPIADGDTNIMDFVERITTEFEKFLKRVSQVVEFNWSRETLKDILIRFLVSLNAYTEASLRSEIESLSVDDPVSTLLVGIEAGGRPLQAQERYVCARFVKYISEDRPSYMPFLSRVASIGLLTEVVEDFVKPTAPATKVNLTIIIDAPLALHYLGLSGKAISEDIQNVFDSLTAIGCRLVVLPDSVEEMRRNLGSMFSRPLGERDGYTWDAIRRGEVSEDYAAVVRNDPEDALEHSGIAIRRIDLKAFPSLHRHFGSEHYEAFYSDIRWVADVWPREHDATCMAITMRLREGKHSSDVFKCQYVFATNNGRFARAARAYCLANRLIHENQCGPVIDQREIATLAWLRTGLGAKGSVPLNYLLAACDAVLRIRTEVTKAVHQKLKEVTPDKLPQYELLLSNQRSVQRLMDQTLGDAHVVTAQNAPQLLAAMERATAEKIEKEYEAKIEKDRKEYEETIGKEKSRQHEIEDERRLAEERSARDIAEKNMAISELERKIRNIERRQEAELSSAIAAVNGSMRRMDRGCTAVILILIAIGVYGYFFTPIESYMFLKVLGGLAGAVGLYHLVQHFRQKPLVGLGNALDWLANRLMRRMIRKRNLIETADRFLISIKYGVISLLEKPPTTTP